MKIQCLLDGIIKVMGQPSHTEYIFDSNNQHIVDILDIDVPDLLSKTKKMGCCGNPVEYKNIFIKCQNN